MVATYDEDSFGSTGIVRAFIVRLKWAFKFFYQKFLLIPSSALLLLSSLHLVNARVDHPIVVVLRDPFETFGYDFVFDYE